MLKSGHLFGLSVLIILMNLLGFINPLYAQDDRNGGFRSFDLQLTKTTDKPAAKVGTRVAFNLQLKNKGPFTAEGIVVFDLLPSGFTFAGSSQPLSYNSIAGEWEVERLAVGDSINLQIFAIVNTIQPASNYTNLAFIAEAEGKDPVTLNDTARVAVHPFDLNVSSVSACVGSQTVLQATATGVVNPVFRWYADVDLTQLQYTGSSFTVLAPETDKLYYVTVSGDNIPSPASSEAVVASLRVLPVPESPQATVVQPNCTIPQGTITVTAPLTPGNLYSIDGATFINASGVFNNVLPGTYRLFVKSSNGCISQPALISINPQPVIPPMPSLSVTQPDCTNGAGRIVVSSPRNAGFRFSIDGADFSDSTGVFSNLLPGVYSVSVKGSGGCISSITTAVIEKNPAVPDAPVLVVTQPDCPAQTGSISVTAPLGAGYTYSIDGNTYANQTGVFAFVTPGTYSITVKNADGCISAATLATINMPVLNEPRLTITAGGSVQICAGGSVVLTASEADNYQWYKYGVPLAGAQSKNYTAISEGVFTVSRRSNTGCLSVQSEGILVTVAPSPAQPVLIAEKRTLCAGDSSVLVAGAAAPMQWFRDGVILDGITDYTLAVKQTGVYTVKSVSALGCAGLQSNPVLIQVLDRPDSVVPELQQPDCYNKGIIRVLSPLITGYSYTIDGLGYLNKTGIFSGLTPGAYRVGAKAANGCTGKLTEVILHDVPFNDTLLTIAANKNTAICVGDSVTLTASAAAGFQWYQNGLAISGANNQTFTALGEGLYTVSRKKAGNCIYPQSQAVSVRIVQPPPAPVIASPKQILCAGETVLIQSSNAVAHQWYRNGQPIAGANAAQLQVQAAGTYVALTSNSAGCSSAFSNPVVITVIDIPATPLLEIDGTTQFCKDETRLLRIKSVPPAHAVQWFRNGIVLPGIFTDTLRINDGAAYKVTVTNSSGCASTPSNTVVTAVVCVTGIHVPDVFTPNGDGVNDVIRAITPGIKKIKSFRIYNRWGNLVFETTDALKGWDGKLRGKEQPAETYIWVVEGADSRGSIIKKTGMLNLIR